jgi:hypothetical protein
LTGFNDGLTFNGSLALGYALGSASGSYSLGPGQIFQVSHELTVGYNAPCILNQTGGTSAVSDRVYIGRNPGADGAYQLSGNGDFSVNEEQIGVQGHGAFVQSGGTHRIANTLYLGYSAGGSGLYQLSGGSLTADKIVVGYAGGTGVFQQSQGSNTISHDLLLGSLSDPASSGSYAISGGSLDVHNGTIQVGQFGQGTFELNGGNVSANAVVVSSSGTFKWTDGTLTIPAGTPIVNDGAFQVLAGDHAVGRIEGNGTTAVLSGSLTAESIVQDTLIIGGTAANNSNAAAVPEPGSFLLLVSAALGMLAFFYRGK